MAGSECEPEFQLASGIRVLGAVALTAAPGEISRIRKDCG